MKATDKQAGISQSLLKALLHYDPETGVFTWLVRPSQQIFPGMRAGAVHRASGYRLIKINGRAFHESRLAWLYMTGEWPSAMIDHENMTKSDNRWCNLRAATRAQNNANRAVQKNNSTGFKGVYARSDRAGWAAMIRKDGVLFCLGTFESPELAAEAYDRAAIEHFGPYARSA